MRLAESAELDLGLHDQFIAGGSGRCSSESTSTPPTAKSNRTKPAITTERNAIRDTGVSNESW